MAHNFAATTKTMSHYHQLSLAENAFSARRKQARIATTLDRIKAFVDWEALEQKVRLIDKTQGGKGGRPRLPLQWMLRMLFVQHLYNVSDPELEDQLIDRKSFQAFVGLHQGVEIPDFSSLWRFKEALAKHGLATVIFDSIIAQLEVRGLLVKKGTAVDATIVQSTTRPLSKAKRKQLAADPSTQIDTDASSTQKGNKKYFGYKGHIGVDIGSKLIRKQTFTTAAPHDSTEFENVLSGDETSLWADSGYVNKKLKRAARALGIYFGVIDRAARNHPLSGSQKKRNRQKSAVRSVVEHPFAFIKAKLHYTKAVAKTQARNALRFTLNCTLYNVLRGNYLIKNQMS